MATPSPNWDLAKSKLPASQAIPNGDIQVDVRLKTTLPDNPKGYLPLFPTATTPETGSLLQYAVQSNGKVTFRVVDEDGFVRRQFNNIQELANSGYNFGFPINADNINIIKDNLNDRLITGTQEKIISAVSTAGSSAAAPAAPAGNSDSPPVTLDPNTKTTITAKNINVKAEGILRYPFNIIDGESRKVSRTNYNGGIGGQDYLQIVIVEYKPVGSTFIRNRTNNSLSTKTKKEELKTTIILPIPSNIQDGNSVGYADGSLDGISAEVARATNNVIGTFSGVTNQTMTDKMATAGNAIFGALNNMGDDLKNEWIRGLAARAAALPGIGNITREQLLARESGGVLNPNMELFFNGVSLRSFKFSFKLTPRNKDEGIEIKRIIRTLKVNMAPKITTENLYLSTPNVFELTYKQGANDHPFLHKFKTCALTDMSVNYTGDGVYATYDDATPISMIMDLTFKELEPIYDTDYDSVGGVGY